MPQAMMTPFHERFPRCSKPGCTTIPHGMDGSGWWWCYEHGYTDFGDGKQFEKWGLDEKFDIYALQYQAKQNIDLAIEFEKKSDYEHGVCGSCGEALMPKAWGCAECDKPQEKWGRGFALPNEPGEEDGDSYPLPSTEEMFTQDELEYSMERVGAPRCKECDQMFHAPTCSRFPGVTEDD